MHHLRHEQPGDDGSFRERYRVKVVSRVICQSHVGAHVHGTRKGTGTYILKKLRREPYETHALHFLALRGTVGASNGFQEAKCIVRVTNMFGELVRDTTQFKHGGTINDRVEDDAPQLLG